MIQAPDFTQRQVFFLNASEISKCALSLRNENILIKNDCETVNKIPINKLLGVLIFGDMTLTSKLLQKLQKAGASVHLLKQNLDTYASINAYAEGNYLLRHKQYFLSDEKALKIAKGIVANKLRNQLALLRGVKVNKIGGLSRVAYKRKMNVAINKADDLASLRGVEGVCSKDFFKTYFEKIDWRRRVPRGKIDENNILLDMGYSFLFNFVDSILRLYGFDTYKGIYHQLYFQRKSLACDMMEPFRCVIDKALVKMHNLGQFDAKDFGTRKGQYYLKYQNNSKYARIFLEEILNYKMDIYHYIRDHYYLILNDEGEVKDFVIR